MRLRRSCQSGFTLVELLIVVIILGVLAAIAIPQFSTSSEDAKISALDTDLSHLRNAIELYYHQHKAIYPGAKSENDGSDVANATAGAAAFVAQLTLYSDTDGVTAAEKDSTYKYGPYLRKGIPVNPFNGLSTVVCDIAEADISVAASGGTAGWKFYTMTGRLIADDGSHDVH
jgi:prepilin-type N-terminal cleavage/methylation domain-containing protein